MKYLSGYHFGPIYEAEVIKKSKMSSEPTNSLVAEPEGSTPLISKPANGHEH
jgi:hypothetical protein